MKKKKKGGHGGGGGGGHDAGGGMRWLLTYSDVVTLLLALFVYLFSISTVNVAKFRQFGEAFAEFFDYGASSSIKDTNAAMGAGDKNSMRQPPRWRVKDKTNNSVMSRGADNEAAEAEREKIEKLKQILMKELRAFLDMGNISISGSDDDLILQLRDASLFDPGSAEIKGEMKTALLKIASQIRAVPNEIRVEGHTDNTPLRGGKFRSNWHLSGARAASVVNFLGTEGGIDPKRLSMAGFAEYHPLVPNYPNYGNPLNRRVEILILARTPSPDENKFEFEEDDN